MQSKPGGDGIGQCLFLTLLDVLVGLLPKRRHDYKVNAENIGWGRQGEDAAAAGGLAVPG